MNHSSDSKRSSIAADAPDPGYKPPPEFEEVEMDPLVGISMTDSTELWLIQWPVNQLQLDDLKGKELSLKLQDNGKLASFESSGKSFDLVSFASQQPDAAVFMASGSESKVVGKISRRVCLVHYPEPSELAKPGRAGLSRQRSPGSSLRVTSGASSVVQMQRSSEMRNKMQGSSEMKNEFSPGTTTPTHSSKRKSSLSSASSAKEQKSSKRKSVGDSELLEFTKSADQSTQDSGWQSAPVSSGHSDHTHEGVSKKKKKKRKMHSSASNDRGRISHHPAIVSQDPAVLLLHIWKRPMYLTTLSRLKSQCVNMKYHYSGTVNESVHVVVGVGGSHLSAFSNATPDWSIFRESDFGFVKLTAFNHSSLLFEYKKSSDAQVYDFFTISSDYRDVLACVHDGWEPTTLAS